jgi:hypothetical protein
MPSANPSPTGINPKIGVQKFSDENAEYAWRHFVELIEALLAE